MSPSVLRGNDAKQWIMHGWGKRTDPRLHRSLFFNFKMKTKYGNIPISFRPTIRVMGLIKGQIKKSGKTMTKVIEECIEKVLGNG